MTIVNKLNIEKHGDSTRLVVLLHAYRKDPLSLRYVRKIIEDTYPHADLLIPELPLKRAFSLARPEEIIAELLIGIDKAWDQRETNGSGGYNDILMVGHSVGALYARKLYVCACGETKDAPFETELKNYLNEKKGKPLENTRKWAKAVDRIILLAGMNRGWSIDHHLFTKNAIQWNVGTVIGGAMMALRLGTPTIFTVRRGEPFITQLRIQWLAMRRNWDCKNKKQIEGLTQGEVGCATVVQLLGTIDDMVSPEDNIDLVAGSDFLYFDVPQSDHKTVIEMDDSSSAGRKRIEVFSDALNLPYEKLKEKENQIFPSDESLIENPKVTDVVFVIHGIRDKGYWTHKIARQVISEARKENKDRLFASVTSTYGYFPMLSFLNPRRRLEKVSG